MRGVEGVQWAVPFFKGQVLARVEQGLPRNVILEAVDDSSLVGAPQELIAGSLADLRRPYAVIVDKAGYEYLWPDESIRLGREFEINDRRAVLVGVCKASPPFVTLPVMYTRFNEALLDVPTKRNLMNFVLAETLPGHQRGRSQRADFAGNGIAGDHAAAILLEHDQLHAQFDRHSGQFRHYDRARFHRRGGRRRADVLLVHARKPQALRLAQSDGRQQPPLDRHDPAAGLFGRRHRIWIGDRPHRLFFRETNQITHLAGLHMTWQAVAGVGAAVLVIVALASLVSMRRVLVLEPAIVFRGT